MMILRTLFLLVCVTGLFSEMAEPYRSIRDLPFDGHGWFSNGRQILQLIENNPPKTVIEVGSWLGCSTRFIAQNLPEGGKLYAVDTWAGSENEAVHMKDPRLPHLYQLFLSNVKHEGLTEIIIPIRMKSEEAAKALQVKAGLIYIDASHETEAVYKDICAWYLHLEPGGVICGDDWSWKSVRKGVEKAAKKLHQTIYSDQNFWWFDPLAL